jgi:hypothetical protein
MNTSRENERWIVDAGDAVIQKKVSDGATALSPADRLVYCLWVADYSMRNAGDLDTAGDLYADFQREAARLARELSLDFTHETFSLASASLCQQYFDRFDRVCEEIKNRATR